MFDFLRKRTVRLSITLSLTVAFFFVELVVGNMTKSVALVADSFHMLSDVLTLLVGLFAIRVSDERKSAAAGDAGVVRLGDAVGAMGDRGKPHE